MNSKSITILLGVFILQTVSSCCFCDDVVSYDVIYESLDLTPIDTSGFSNTEVSDTVFKQSFGLEVSVNSDWQVVSNSSIFKNFGFSSAYACSCPDDEVNTLDPIASADVFMIVEGGEEIRINALFNVVRYNTNGINLMSLTEYFSIRSDGRGSSFQMELIDGDDLPNKVSFKVDVNLDSGRKFTQQTEQILFFD